MIQVIDYTLALSWCFSLSFIEIQQGIFKVEVREATFSVLCMNMASKKYRSEKICFKGSRSNF